MESINTGKLDSKGKSIKVGDVVSYFNKKYPNKTQPLHGILFKKGKFILTVNTGRKHYKNWKPMEKFIKSPAERWTIIGDHTLYP